MRHHTTSPARCARTCGLAAGAPALRLAANEEQVDAGSDRIGLVVGIEVEDIEWDQTSLAEGGYDLPLTVGTLLVRLMDLDPLAAGENGPSGYEGQSAGVLLAVRRGDLEMERLPLPDERLLHPPDLGVDVWVIHIEEQERVGVHEPAHRAKRFDQLSPVLEMIEAVVQTGDA